jgi:hypothetical protein
VRKIIADRVSGWNWEIDIGEASLFVTKTNVVLGAAESVRGDGMHCEFAGGDGGTNCDGD